MTTDSGTSNTSISGQIQEDLKKLGKYEIVRKIGAGGMGTVYLAQDTRLNRTVALKVLPKDRAENSILVRRFQSEARASAMLTHDNIISVYDADKADGYLYIALEFVEGIDLFEWLRKRERIPVKRSIDIIKQVAAALQHAHEKNLVHRDIKPANIMINKEGVVKLADMGLARSVDESLDTTITRDGTTVGTVDYMSPEQAANSKSTDIRSDIYSLGCTWYHMLTGSPPFPEGSLTNKLAAHAKKTPPDPREINPDISESLVAIIHRMMSKKKEDRYQTPAELIEDIENSANLEANSAHLLSVLLEDESEEQEVVVDEGSHVAHVVFDDLEEDSSELEVQEESQSQLLKKKTIQKQAGSTSEIPGRKQKQNIKDKQAHSPSPPTKKQPAPAEQSQEHSATPRKQKLKPLKRVQSQEELTSNSREQKARPASQVKRSAPERIKQPQQKGNTNSHKQSQTGTKTKASRKHQGAKQAQNTPTRNTTSPAASNETSKGVDIDWMRMLLVMGTVGLALLGAWWGMKQFGGSEDPVEANPYAEEDIQSLNNLKNSTETPQTNQRPTEPEDGTETVNAVLQPTVHDDPVKPSQPQWVVAGWDRPVADQSQTVEVQRGTSNQNSFSSLEDAFTALSKDIGTIEVTNYSNLSVTPTEIQLSRKLSVASTGIDSILTFSPKDDATSWLTVKGATLEIRNLHFIVNNLNKSPVNLIHLAGTDLILRNCTFTSLGTGPVCFIDVTGKSKNSNRIFVENCLFRGKHAKLLHAKNTSVDFYCKNSLAFTESEALVSVEQRLVPERQSMQFSNCTLGSASNLFALSFSNRVTSLASLSLKLHRSILIGQGEAAIPIHFNSHSDDPPNQNFLEVLHSRFVNFHSLAPIAGGAQKRNLRTTKEFQQFFGTVLPSDDLIELEALRNISKDHELITAESLEPVLHSISRPGVGERSLIGVDTSSVAVLDSSAIQRQNVVQRAQALALALATKMQAQQTFQNEIRFDLQQSEQLANFINSKMCPDGTTLICYGSGLRRIPPIKLAERKLKISFEQTEGIPLKIQCLNSTTTEPLFHIDGGEVVIEKGRFEFPLSRSQREGTILLNASGSTQVSLKGCEIWAHPEGTGENQLLKINSGGNLDAVNYVNIENCMLHSGGTVLYMNRAELPVSLYNSILISKHDLIDLHSTDRSNLLWIQQSTMLAGHSIVHASGEGGTPLDVLVEQSVFSPLEYSNPRSALFSGEGSSVIRKSFRWWEKACAHSEDFERAISTTDMTSPAGSYTTTLKRFCGPHHVYSPLSGRQAVIFTNNFEETLQPAANDFALAKTGQSATWGDRSTPVGADEKLIGPNGLSAPPKPRTGPFPNVPAGF